MQLIRGSALYKFMTTGLFNKTDDYLQGLSGCKFALALLDKVSGVVGLSTSAGLVLIGFLLEIFGQIPADVVGLPFILFLSLVFFWIGLTIFTGTFVIFCFVYLRNHGKLPNIKVPNINCGTVKVLDKRIEK